MAELEFAFDQIKGQLQPHVNREADTGTWRNHYFLHAKIADRFNEAELDGLIHSLGFNSEEIVAETHSQRCLEFVLFMQRRERTPELIARLKELRPRYAWKR